MGHAPFFACHAGIQNDRPWNQALLIAKIYSQICHGWRHFPLSWLGLKVAFGGDKCKQDVLTRPPLRGPPQPQRELRLHRGKQRRRQGWNFSKGVSAPRPHAPSLPTLPPPMCSHTAGRCQGGLRAQCAPGQLPGYHCVPRATPQQPLGPPGSDGLGDKEERCAWPRSQAAQLRPVSVLSGGS